MSDIAQQNLDILCSRWPELASRVLASQPPANMHWDGDENDPTLSVDGHRLWSAYDTDSEARIQASMIPEEASLAWVYGVGSGDLIRELLKRDTLAHVNVVPMNLGLLHFLMHVLDQRDWLSNSRINLLDPSSQRDVQAPFVAIPACLTLCDKSLWLIKEKLVHELNGSFEEHSLATRAQTRHRHIRENMVHLESDADVTSLFGTQPGSIAFVCGAGPTLGQTAPWIEQHRDQGPLIAVDGALTPLLRIGLVPDYVISLDDNPETIIRYFDGDISQCADRTLIYAPIVDPHVLSRWPGSRMAMYTHESIYDELRQTIIRGELFVSGSVIHPAIDLAVKLSARKVVLFGVDFGFPNGQVHANDQAPIDFYTNAALSGTQTRNGLGHPISTLASFNGYRLNLERYIAQHPQIRFINSSRDGAFIQGTTYLEVEDG